MFFKVEAVEENQSQAAAEKKAAEDKQEDKEEELKPLISAEQMEGLLVFAAYLPNDFSPLVLFVEEMRRLEVPVYEDGSAVRRRARDQVDNSAMVDMMLRNAFVEERVDQVEPDPDDMDDDDDEEEEENPDDISNI